MHLAFHPRADVLIVATADKGGRIGLWHVDRDLGSLQMPEQSSAELPSEDANAADDSILVFAPHHSYVCGLR